METKVKADCYKCKYRGGVPGSCHSSCHHPKVEAEPKNNLSELMSLLGGGRSLPLGMMNESKKELNIKCNSHGLNSGWFNWPYNFDPVWLENCDGFEQKTDSKV
mgnify:CR=1 FL=1